MTKRQRLSGGHHFVDRIRRFWSPALPPDHPLSQEERDEMSLDNEKARALETIVGGESDPDDDRIAGY